MGRYIYFDNNATTQPLDEVVAAMEPFLRTEYANPSSVHQFGQAVRHQVECAREKVAGLIGADPKEIVFTSGGTESINLAVRGALQAAPQKRHVVTSTVEHSAVRKLTQQLQREGYRFDEVGVDEQGRLNLDELDAKLGDETALVSVMVANNETGVLFDVDRIAAIAADKGVPLHLDAVQAVGKIPIDVDRIPAALLSLSGHKFHGPKGVGALYVRKRTRVRPLLIGGSQERNLRAGTENVPGIVGLGVAAEVARERGLGECDRVRAMRDALENGIGQAVPIARVNGADADRIGNTTNIGFKKLQSEAILILLSENGVCVSAGSACSSGSLEPSHVLQAMGVDPEYAHGSIRFSLSRFNTTEEVNRVVELIPSLVSRLTPAAAR